MWYELKLDVDGDTWLVTAPAFPEVTTFGETNEEALRNGLSAILEAIAARIAASVDVPAPIDEDGLKFAVQIPSAVFLKAALYMTLRVRGLTRADLQRLMGEKNRTSVDRLFNIEHKSKLESMDAAFRALGIPLFSDVPFPVAA